MKTIADKSARCTRTDFIPVILILKSTRLSWLTFGATLWLGLWLNHRSDEISQADQDRADAVAAAERFTETWNTFKPNQVSIAGTYERSSQESVDEPLAEVIFVHMQAGF